MSTVFQPCMASWMGIVIASEPELEGMEMQTPWSVIKYPLRLYWQVTSSPLSERICYVETRKEMRIGQWKHTWPALLPVFEVTDPLRASPSPFPIWAQNRPDCLTHQLGNWKQDDSANSHRKHAANHTLIVLLMSCVIIVTNHYPYKIYVKWHKVNQFLYNMRTYSL